MASGAPDGAVGAGVTDARVISGDCATMEFLLACCFFGSGIAPGGVAAAEEAGEGALGGC